MNLQYHRAASAQAGEEVSRIIRSLASLPRLAMLALAVSLLAALTTLPLLTLGVQPSSEPYSPVVLAGYHTWHGVGVHTAAPYNSLDPAVIERHIAQARRRGIDAFVVDWYGRPTGNPGADRDFIDRGLAMLQPTSRDRGFHTAIMYDEGRFEAAGKVPTVPVTAEVIEDLRYAEKRYFGHVPPRTPDDPRNAYLEIDGKPVVFVYPKGATVDWRAVRSALETEILLIDLNPDPTEDLKLSAYDAQFDGFYAWVEAKEDGEGLDWGEDYLNWFYATMRLPAYKDKKLVGGVWAGFDDSKARWGRNRFIWRRCGQTWRDTWALARASAAPYVIVSTWNDIEEGSDIEYGVGDCRVFLPVAVSKHNWEVTYTVDDFDDVRLDDAADPGVGVGNNDFLGDRDVLHSNKSVVVATPALACAADFSCHLALTYDVPPNHFGGFWEKLGTTHAVSEDHALDLRGLNTFRFRVRAEPRSAATETIEVELKGPASDSRQSILKRPVGNVGPEWRWVQIPINDTSDFDWSRVSVITFIVNNSGGDHRRAGRLFLDDLAFTERDTKRANAINASPDGLLDLIERRAFQYFWENRHPKTGLVIDRGRDPHVTSVAAVGYELAALGIGAERGWITRDEAAGATLHVLNTLAEARQGPEVKGMSGYNGFFYHLLEIDTGLRDYHEQEGQEGTGSEVSTVDTALLMAGVLFARQYFTGTVGVEREIHDRATTLVDRVNWRWPLRTDAVPAERRNQFYMAWKPERRDCEESNGNDCYEIPDQRSGAGFFSGTVEHPTTWDYYTDEIVLINVLAMGAEQVDHRVGPETFWAWKRVQGEYNGISLYQTYFGQLFAYFIGQHWLDLRGRLDMNPDTGAVIDWFCNTHAAALANRQYAIDRSGLYEGYSEVSWGLSAGLGPPYTPEPGTPKPPPAEQRFGEYRGYGAPPRVVEADPDDGTVLPYAVAGSLVFLSAESERNEAVRALRHWFRNEPRLWGLYGFRDGFNRDRNWYANDWIGIDLGMTLLAIENYRTELVWETMGRDPFVQRGLRLVFSEPTEPVAACAARNP